MNLHKLKKNPWLHFNKTKNNLITSNQKPPWQWKEGGCYQPHTTIHQQIDTPFASSSTKELKFMLSPPSISIMAFVADHFQKTSKWCHVDPGTKLHRNPKKTHTLGRVTAFFTKNKQQQWKKTMMAPKSQWGKGQLVSRGACNKTHQSDQTLIIVVNPADLDGDHLLKLKQFHQCRSCLVGMWKC